MDRREFVIATALTAASAAVPEWMQAQNADLKPVFDEVDRRRDEAVQRLQTWIKQPSIAAENRGMNEGNALVQDMLRDCGFTNIEKVSTDGQPGVYALMDNGAKHTIGLYFMYDVKQVDPSEWSSPPFEARLVDKPNFGKCVVGRGAVNQKGPEATFLAALFALKATGRKPPVNFVFVAEGEEEIGSPHFYQIVRRPDILANFKKCDGVYMPSAGQDPDGMVTLTFGAKGVVELELTSSGEKWGRGPRADVHSSNKARLDAPAWHLIQALATMVSKDGNTIMIDGYGKSARPISAEEKAMCADAARRMNEATVKKSLSTDHWINDVDFEKSLEMLVADPTCNIEGLVGGYTGPGGKTVLPHMAKAKMDLRLVPDMTAAESLAQVKAHLKNHGFGDIDVNMSGGYDPTTTPQDAKIIQAEIAVYKRRGIDPIKLPRNAGSWPGYVFTGDPLRLPAGHFGMGHGSGAHAPNEYYVIESSNPKVLGMADATKAHVEYLYELASM